MSDGTLNAALERLDFNTQSDQTTHGFRAMARAMIVERLDEPHREYAAWTEANGVYSTTKLTVWHWSQALILGRAITEIAAF